MIKMDFYIVSSLKQQSPDGQYMLLFLNSDVVAAEKNTYQLYSLQNTRGEFLYKKCIIDVKLSQMELFILIEVVVIYTRWEEKNI